LLSFFAGGVVGVLIYQAIGGVLLFGAAGLLLAIALIGLQRARMLRNEVSLSQS
jgi:hypothetical protein